MRCRRAKITWAPPWRRASTEPAALRPVGRQVITGRRLDAVKTPVRDRGCAQAMRLPTEGCAARILPGLCPRTRDPAYEHAHTQHDKMANEGTPAVIKCPLGWNLRLPESVITHRSAPSHRIR